jgi:hypothetical protein
MANCLIACKCSGQAAEEWSTWKEETDLEKCLEYNERTGRWDHGFCYSAYQETDFEDNATGRAIAHDNPGCCDFDKCEEGCDHLDGLPDGPPGPFYEEYVP